MRIALYHDLPSGGAKRALYEQVRGLRRLGHTVDAFVPATANEEFLPLDGVADSVTTYPIAAPPPRERMLAGRPRPGDPARWLRHFAHVRRLSRVMAEDIDAGAYDVALVHPSQFTQAPWVLRTLRTPSLYYCHEPLRAAHEPRISTPLVRALIRTTIGRIDRRNFAAADCVAVNSAFTAANVQRIYGRIAEINYLGVDIERFHPRAAAVADYVLTVGALHPLKGLDFVIASLAAVPSARRPPCVLVSDRARDADRARIAGLAAASGVQLRIEQQVSDERLAELYAGARLVLYAPYSEPFGFVPLEAMASGRPILAVRDGGIPESVGDGVNGFLEERDTARFAARIDALLGDRDGTERIARQGAELVRLHWTWPRSVRELESLCLSTAAGRGRVAA